MDENTQVMNGGETTACMPPEGAGGGLVRVLWRGSPLLAGAAALGLLVAGVYVLASPDRYVSEARLYVEPHSPRMLSEDPGVMTESKNYLHTQAELLRSGPILTAAMEQPALAGLAGADGADHLKGFISANVGQRDDIITVACRMDDPQQASATVNAVVDAYVAFHAKAKRSTVEELLRILQDEKRRRDSELDERLSALVRFKQEHGALALDSSGDNVVEQGLLSLSSALVAARLETIDARVAHEAQQTLAAQSATVTAWAAQGPAWLSGPYRDERGRLRVARGDLQARLALEGERFNADSPAVQLLQGQIERVDERLAESARCLSQECLEVSRQRLATAQAKEQSLEQALDRQQRLAQEVGVQAAQYMVLESEARRTERLCDILDSRIKELDLSAEAGSLNITLLERARPATSPTRPNLPMTLGLGALVGLAAGAGLVAHRHWSDPRLHTVQDAWTALGAPVMGRVPSINGVRDRAQVVRQKPDSSAAEACRQLRTALHYAMNGSPRKTLLITSACPGEGKTTLAANLAIALAQSGRRTVLVDANLRRPELHRVFRLPDETGLAELLEGKGSAAQKVHATGVVGLDVLTAGRAAQAPSDLLACPALPRVLEELAGRYDWVIVDSPAITVAADAPDLAAACQGTLLVVRTGTTRLQTAWQAAQRLAHVPARVIGSVMNGDPAAVWGRAARRRAAPATTAEAPPTATTAGDGADEQAA